LSTCGRGAPLSPNDSAFLSQVPSSVRRSQAHYASPQEINNGRLHGFIRALPETTLLTSVCTGSWIYGRMGLLDGKAATNRKEPTGWKPPPWARCRSIASPRSRRSAG
jgi:hypothetical protein